MSVSRRGVAAIAVGCLCGIGGVLAIGASSSSAEKEATAGESEVVMPEAKVPPTEDVWLTVAGRKVLAPSTLEETIDLKESELLGTMRGEIVVSAALRRTGEPCYVAFPESASADAAISVGCDPRADLIKKGGWLVSRADANGTRTGLLIMVSESGPLKFTTSAFTRVTPGTRVSVRQANGAVTTRSVV